MPDPYGGVDDSYQLVHLSGSYSFADRYMLTFGIENLLDKEPPLMGGNPTTRPFPIAPHATSIGTGGSAKAVTPYTSRWGAAPSSA